MSEIDATHSKTNDNDDRLSLKTSLGQYYRTDTFINLAFAIATPIVGTKVGAFFLEAAQSAYQLEGLTPDTIVGTLAGGAAIGLGIGYSIKNLFSAASNALRSSSYKYEASLINDGLSDQEVWQASYYRKRKSKNTLAKIGTATLTVASAFVAVASAKAGLPKEAFAPATIAAIGSGIALWSSIVNGMDLKQLKPQNTP